MRMSGRFNFIYLIIALAIFTFPASAQIISNEQAVILAARAGVDENFNNGAFEAVKIEVGESEISRPVAIGLAEGFENININVVGNAPADSSVKKIECDILGFDFKYENGDSRGFLQRRMIKRKFTAFLKVTVIDPEIMSVSEIKDITINYEDQINPELADLVKSRTIHALAPRFPSSGYKRVVEPVIVTGAVGSLIYLFFANR